MAACFWVRRAIVALAVLAGLLPATAGERPNQLSAKEKRSGWSLLFDGNSLDGWVWTPDAVQPTPSWEVVDGTLRATPKRGMSVYLVTREDFDDFELTFDFRVPKAGNSGVKYRFQGYVVNGKLSPTAAGSPRIEPIALEYQITDDLANPDALSAANRSSGALYGYLAPDKKQPVNPGKWHHGRILARGLHLEHGLDGKKVMEIDLGTDAARKLFVATRRGWALELANQPNRRSPIALQLHDGAVQFRNLKIRRL